MPSLYDVLNLVDEKSPEGYTPVDPKTRVSAKDLCRGILNSTQYRESLLQRIIFKELPPAVECRLWDYAYGKPVERVEVNDKTRRFNDATPEQLELRARFLMEAAHQLRTEERTTNDVAVHQPSDEDGDDSTPSVH